MITFPYAKINIGLNVVSKRNDGYHNLESIFCPIPLCDILEIVKSDQFEFTSSGIAMDSAHLITEAYYLMKHRYKIGPVKIHLHKIIPLGAGLGGGSSNGAFTLRMLNQLFDLHLSESELRDIALILGSDCPFFIGDGPAKVSGRGEIVEPIYLDFQDHYIKIVNPGIHVSTQEAFSGMHPKTAEHSPLAITDEVFFDALPLLNNDFEDIIFKIHPEIKEIKEKLLAEGAVYASMTGTGSTVYGFYKTAPKRTFPEALEFIGKLK